MIRLGEFSGKKRRVREHIKVERSEVILTLTMARPEKKNALTDVMYKALADTLEGASRDRQTRVVVIKAEARHVYGR